VTDLKAFQDRLASAPRNERATLFKGLLTVNKRVYAYFAQVKLKELGDFAGKPNGRLNQATMRALTKHCRQRAIASFCGKGPLNSQVAEILSFSF
jgi:hypothetical protein